MHRNRLVFIDLSVVVIIWFVTSIGLDHRLVQPAGADSISAQNGANMKSAPTHYVRKDDQDPSILPGSAVSRELVMGVVPQFEARTLHSIWEPVVKEIGKRTGVSIVFQGAPTIAAFEKAFMTGRYDLAYMNPYHYLIAHQHQGYIPLVRDVGKALSGVLVVRKDSPVKTPHDLQGAVIAFPSPNALGASLQMRQELSDLFHISFSPNYVKTHDSVYLNVILGQAMAGGGVQKTLNRQPETYRRRLNVIHITQPVSPHPVAVHPRVSLRLQQKIQQAFLTLGKESKGMELLEKIPVKQIGKATFQDYDALQTMKLERFYVTPQ